MRNASSHLPYSNSLRNDLSFAVPADGVAFFRAALLLYFALGRRLGGLVSTLTLRLRWYCTLAECPWPCLCVYIYRCVCAFTVTTTTGMPRRSTNWLLFLHQPSRSRRRRRRRRRRRTAGASDGAMVGLLPLLLHLPLSGRCSAGAGIGRPDCGTNPPGLQKQKSWSGRQCHYVREGGRIA